MRPRSIRALSTELVNGQKQWEKNSDHQSPLGPRTEEHLSKQSQIQYDFHLHASKSNVVIPHPDKEVCVDVHPQVLQAGTGTAWLQSEMRTGSKEGKSDHHPP